MAHGGARKGAGRKRSPIRELQRARKTLKAVSATLILAQIDELESWKDLLRATRTLIVGEKPMDVPDYKTRLEALKYLTDRRDGKAPQAVQITGEDGDSPVKVMLIGAKNV